jgi:hypothetical protein
MADVTDRWLLDGAMKACREGMGGQVPPSRNAGVLWLAVQCRDNGLSQTDAGTMMTRFLADLSAAGHEYSGKAAEAALDNVYGSKAREPIGRTAGMSRGQLTQEKLRQTFALPPRQAPAARRPPSADTLRRLMTELRPVAGTPGEDYLRGRGISIETARAAHVRFHPAWPFAPKKADGKTKGGGYTDRPAVVFGFHDPEGAWVEAASGRRADPPDVRPDLDRCHTSGARGPGMFWTEGAREAEPVILVEGPMDALALAECGYPAMARIAADYPTWLPKFTAGRLLYVAWDFDTVGEDHTAKVASACTQAGAKCFRLRPPIGKDFNEALQQVGRDALAAYLHEQVGAYCARCGELLDRLRYDPGGRAYLEGSAHCEIHDPEHGGRAADG